MSYGARNVATAKPRSALAYEQDRAFIPNHPLPKLPHKNSTRKEALALAKQWGCLMKVGNTNDIIVSHPILTAEKVARTAIPVSFTGEGPSQGLVSFLRKLELEVLKRRGPAPVRAAPVGGMARVITDAITNGQLEVKQEPAAKPDYIEAVALPEAPPDWEKAIETLLDHAHRNHYKFHVGEQEHKPFDECANSACQAALKAAGALRSAYEELEEAFEKSEADGLAMLEENLKLSDELAVKAICPATTLAQSAGLSSLPHTKVVAEEKFNVAMTLTRDAPIEVRQGRLVAMYYEWKSGFEKMFRTAANSYGGVCTRTADAIFMAMEQTDWHYAWEACYLELDFNRWKNKIMNCTRDKDSQRKMVGAVAWADLEAACAAMRKKNARSTPQSPTPTPPPSSADSIIVKPYAG